MARFILNEDLNTIYKNPLVRNSPNRNPYNSSQYNSSNPHNINSIDRSPIIGNNHTQGENEDPDNIQTTSSFKALTEPTESESQKGSSQQESSPGFHQVIGNKSNLLDLGKENLLNGIILSEILGKPRAKRGFRR